MKQSGYAKRLEQERRVRAVAMEQTMRQFMVDMFMLALNDPDVMGKSVLGYNRLVKVVDAVVENYKAFGNAVDSRNPDADYCRECLDERLRKIVPDDAFASFMERYVWLVDVKYEAKR